MPSRAYPVDADIQSFVALSGVSMPDGFQFSGYGAAAALEWERRTCYVPFVQDAAATPRTYDPPGQPQANISYETRIGGGRLLGLGAAIKDSSALVSVTVDGVAKTLGTDFRLAPLNAPSNKKPYNRIEFFQPIYGTASSVVVTAKWGAQSDIDELVWQAIVRIGAAMAARDLLQSIFSSPTTIKIGDEEVTQNSFRQLGDSWDAYATRIADLYTPKGFAW